MIFSMVLVSPIVVRLFTPEWGLFASFVTPVVLTALVVRRFGYPCVVVGTDGVRVEGGLRTRFVPFDRMTEVKAVPNGFVIFQKDGSLLRLPTFGQSQDETYALHFRLRAGMVVSLLAGDGRLLGLLERGERSIAAWKEAMGRLASTEGGSAPSRWGSRTSTACSATGTLLPTGGLALRWRCGR
jgi:hypothetical protein